MMMISSPTTIIRGVWKSEEELRPSRLQHCQDQPKYSEESKKPAETCCHLNFGEQPPANAGVKTSQGMKE